VEGDGTQELPLADLMFANRNSRLVQDYRHWFIGELADGLEDDYEEDGDEDAEKDVEELEPWLVAKQPRWLGLTLVRLEIVAFAAAYGAVMGAVVAVMPWAKWAACIGGGVWGAVMAIALAASARTHFPEFAPRFRKVIAVPFGLIAGAVQGAFLGVAVVALLGAALGTVAGLLLRRLIPHRKRPVFRIIPGGVVCAAACGVAAQAIYVDRVEATRGLAWGALIGLNAGLLFWLLAVPLMKRMANKQP
jgi:hypothetical protein